MHDTAGEGTDVNKWLLLWRNVWFSGRKQGVSVSVQPAAIGAVMGAYGIAGTNVRVVSSAGWWEGKLRGSSMVQGEEL